MKTKIPARLAKNASKLHKHVGDLLMQSIFKGYDVRQEYPVKGVDVYFRSGREKFDWVILRLKVVIEVMGEQHFKPVRFGGISVDEAVSNFEELVRRDIKKRKAAERAGWAYVAIHYTDADIGQEELEKRILEALEDAEPDEDYEPKKPKGKIQSKGFQKKPEGYKYQWPKRKINQ